VPAAVAENDGIAEGRVLSLVRKKLSDRVPHPAYGPWSAPEVKTCFTLKGLECIRVAMREIKTEILVRMKIAIASGVFALILVSGGLLAAQTKAKPATTPQPGTSKQEVLKVSGRVFAITQLGDLKPGRLAKVYLLWGNVGLNSKGEVDTVTGRGITAEQNPEVVYLSNILEQQQTATKDTESDLNSVSPDNVERFACKRQLSGIDAALLATLDSMIKHRQNRLVYSTDADEEGNFQFKSVAAGDYLLIARGQASANDVYWEEDLCVRCFANKVLGTDLSRVKLSSVKKSCTNFN